MKKEITSATKGCGWQRIGALINLGAYYLMSIPSSIILAFVYHLGRKTGIIVALSVQASSLAIVTLNTNWKQEANKATNRVCSTTNLADALS
ncbi:hypothetical protein QQP08_025229 [Theobroma cacao]|nr:hypothetical protein QQP08_025229 [Theobroma cacao]